MVSDSKILTVSYGTFSCTLEGFDDPFSTMRSIAEYFRDLAADDRYFGAEPPTPDPQMLSSIAEKEIQRRVEARVQEGGLVLRQMEQEQDAKPAEAPAQPVARSAPAISAPEAAAPVAPVTPPTAEPTNAPIAEPASPHGETAGPQTPPAGSSIADKLERIRAAVAQRNQAEFAEDQNEAMNFGSNVAPESFEDDGVEEALVVEPVQDEVPVSAELSAENEADIGEEVEDKVEAAEIETGAEKPSRIAAPFQEAAAIIAEMNDESDDTASEDLPEDEDDQDATLGNVLSSLQSDEAVITEAEAEIADEIADEITDTDTALHEMDPNLAADIAEATRPVETAEDEAANDPLQRVRARVVKMRRSDFEAETQVEDAAANANEEKAEEADAEESPEALTETLRRELGTSTLDAEDEDELMRELAEVAIAAEVGEEGEIGEDIEEEAPAAFFDDEDEVEDDSDARNVFDTSDASMSRLMDETDREMAKGENTRRRNAIQHLKAAVTAIRAEKSEKGDVSEEDEAEVYKEDLARVVRPRRPEGASQTRRQLPPLMLVSEQRIDTPKDVPGGANITPVRPRRVSRAALAVQENEALETAEEIHTTPPKTGITFADFAEAQGAESLADVLEAAAAFSNFVQGRETVSRPQIMHLAKEAMPQDVPVEERLRSFGQLLRQGKIRKQSRGQFTVADTTRFKPQ
jgi:hypothetical protein